MSFFENTRKPTGFGGKLMVLMMNVGHRALSGWGLRFLKIAPDAKVLDCGCGGGANIRALLKKCPKGIVKGIDYSAVSAEQARKRNADAIQAGRCAVWQGSVEQIIFASGWFDAVTAFETVYFWPGLVPCFREVYRVLKPDGTFLICNECGGDIPGDEKWTQRISGMRIYKDTQLKAALEEAGFRDVQIYKHKRDWLCVLARNTGKVLTHNYILKEVWGSALASDTPSLRVFMATLRKKIEKDPSAPRYIQTHIGVGYRMIRQ